MYYYTLTTGWELNKEKVEEVETTEDTDETEVVVDDCDASESHPSV